jgi:hypothetical protein
MSILLSAIVLCGLSVDSTIVDTAIWKENGDHIFVIGGREYDVGGVCHNIENDGGGVHRYTWINREGVYEVCFVTEIFVEIDGILIGVEE